MSWEKDSLIFQLTAGLPSGTVSCLMTLNGRRITGILFMLRDNLFEGVFR